MQLLAMVGDAERWGEGSHADRLERIIARAEMADRLERQLARECEKRQKAEFELKRLQANSEKQRELQVERLQNRLKRQYEPTNEIPREYELIAVAKPESVETDFNWRSVPNAELNGDRRHDAYAEKLRRSFEAVQEYNAGLDDSEQFAITGSLLCQFTGVKPALVKQFPATITIGLSDN